MTILLHLANFLYLAAYLVKSMVLLRVLSIIAGVLCVGYFLWMGLWTPIIWQFVFISINLFFIFRKKINES